MSESVDVSVIYMNAFCETYEHLYIDYSFRSTHH